MLDAKKKKIFGNAEATNMWPLPPIERPIIQPMNPKKSKIYIFYSEISLNAHPGNTQNN